MKRLRTTLSMTLAAAILATGVWNGAALSYGATPLPATTVATQTDASTAPAFEETEPLTADDIPCFMTLEGAEANGHAERMTDMETDLSTAVFRNESGTYTLYSFGEPIKYEGADGGIRDRSLELTADADGGVAVLDNDVQTIFPDAVSPGQGVTIQTDDLKITMAPAAMAETVFTGNNGNHNGAGKGNTDKGKVSAPGQSKKADVAKSNNGKKNGGKIAYADAFGQNVELQYIPTLNGVKEDIILSASPDYDTFTFDIATNGLALVQTEDAFVLTDADGNIKATGSPLTVVDANGNDGAENAYYTVTEIEANQQYQIGVTVDRDWLGGASYPVVVDPSFAMGGASTGGTDITIYSNGTATGKGLNNVGKPANGYESRTLYKFNSILTYEKFMALSSSQITTARIYFWRIDGTAGSTDVTCYQNTVNFSDADIANISSKWSTLWNGASTSYSNTVTVTPDKGVGDLGLTYSSTNPASIYNNYFYWDMTALVKKWQDRSISNFGIQLQCKSGSANTAIRCFAGADFDYSGGGGGMDSNGLASCPALVIEYNATFPDPGIDTNATYNIQTLYSGCLTVEPPTSGTNFAGTKATISAGNASKQSFRFEKDNATGYYFIRPIDYDNLVLASDTNYNVVLKAKNASDTMQLWRIKNLGNGYYQFVNKYRETYGSRMFLANNSSPVLMQSPNSNIDIWALNVNTDLVCWPVSPSAAPAGWNYITSFWGYRRLAEQNEKVADMHNGVDVSFPVNTPVRAMMNGKVETTSYMNGGGNYIVLSHTVKHLNSTYTVYTEYQHLNSFSVSVGQQVYAGQQIALSGNTGSSNTGDHLHFQVQYGPSTSLNTINPLQCYQPKNDTRGRDGYINQYAVFNVTWTGKDKYYDIQLNDINWSLATTPNQKWNSLETNTAKLSDGSPDYSKDVYRIAFA